MLLTTNPANTAPRNPIHALWEKALTTTPTNAEISIVPSSAILLVPDLDEIIAELMSRRQQNIVKKMHDDLQDVIAQETAEKAAQVENEQE